jgi:type VI secretion system protein ImpC
MPKSTNAQAVVVANDQVVEKSLLDQIADQVHAGPEPGPNLSPAELEEANAARGRVRRRGKDLIKEFIAQVLDGTITVAKDAEMMINARIAQIDHLVSLQLNEIMHHPGLQKLEGTWRGLKYLMDQSETGAMLKIKILNCNKKELLKDLQRAPEFDQSSLFKKVYEEEYGVFGGSPFAALVGDYEFGKHPEDIELLEQVSHVAAAAHAPFIAATAPDMLNLPDWRTLDAPRDLTKVFDTTEYAKWKSFRQSEDSRYVALCLPRVLGRLPYGKDTKPIEDFNYEEHVDGSDHSKYLWMNAAYALAARMTNSFSSFGMCVAMRGVEGGGLVQGLPVHNYYTDAGVPRKSQLPTGGKKSWPIWASLRWCTAKTPTMPHSSPSSRRKSRSCTTPMQPTRMRVYRHKSPI